MMDLALYFAVGCFAIGHGHEHVDSRHGPRGR